MKSTLKRNDAPLTDEALARHYGDCYSERENGGKSERVTRRPTLGGCGGQQVVVLGQHELLTWAVGKAPSLQS